MPADEPIAFLVLAHHQPGLCARLARALAGPGTQSFVHVDARTDITPFVGALAGVPGTTLLDQRVAVHWAGFSMVRATLALLTVARRAGPFGRYCLLSGTDLPLRPREEIVARLRADDREWMRVRFRLAGTEPRREDRRIHAHHWNDVALLNPRARPRSPFGRVLRRGLRAGAALSNHLVGPRTYPSGFVPYKGSQWWCLTDACVRHVQSVVAARPDFVRFHRTVFAPDEIFFHSIVKASPFADRISHDVDAATHEPDVAALHYVRWDGLEARVLEAADHARLMASSALFARKLDTQRSRTLLALLDVGAPTGERAMERGR